MSDHAKLLVESLLDEAKKYPASVRESYAWPTSAIASFRINRHRNLLRVIPSRNGYSLIYANGDVQHCSASETTERCYDFLHFA